MYETDFEHAEKKLIDRFDEKLRDLKEVQRQDRNDYNNKLATLKADISLVTFEKGTFNFIKDKVYLEWNTQTSKSKTNELRLDELVKKNERMRYKLKQSL